MANQVGKRYVCKKRGAEFIVTRGGDGQLHCCGAPMEIKKRGYAFNSSAYYIL